MLRLVKPTGRVVAFVPRPADPTNQGMPTIDTITDAETGRRGVLVRPSEDAGLTIMEDAETGGQAVVIWLTGPGN
jgi:hypothetical protein